MNKKTKLYIVGGFLGGFVIGVVNKIRRDDFKHWKTVAQVELQTAMNMKEMFAQGYSDEEVAQYYREQLVFLETVVKH